MVQEKEKEKQIMYRKRDIVLVPVPFSDNKNRKVRPALVISNEEVHSTGDAIIVQITSKNKSDSLSIEINEKDITKQLPVKSFIRCHKIFVLEQTLIIEKISELKVSKYKSVVRKINEIIK